MGEDGEDSTNSSLSKVTSSVYKNYTFLFCSGSIFSLSEIRITFQNTDSETSTNRDQYEDIEPINSVISTVQFILSLSTNFQSYNQLLTDSVFSTDELFLKREFDQFGRFAYKDLVLTPQDEKSEQPAKQSNYCDSVPTSSSTFTCYGAEKSHPFSPAKKSSFIEV